MSQQKGFTLIELVIVITLLGILAATALPKFANLTGSAYSATNNGAGGALASAVNIAHSAYIASGQTTAGTIALECTTATPNTSGNIAMSTSGWPNNAIANAAPPACTAAAAGSNTPTVAECVNIWNNIMTNPPTAATTCVSTTGVCYVTTAPAGQCSYQMFYNGTVVAPTRSVTYTLISGTITIVSP